MRCRFCYMGGSQSYHEPPWTTEDARSARPLPIELREKLVGLDYRVRKCLGRLCQDEDERRADMAAEVESQFCVGYHNQGVPESLDRLCMIGAKFTVDLDDLERARRNRHPTDCHSSAHSVILEPPVVELPAGSPDRLPRVRVSAWFSIAEVAPTRRLRAKAPVGAAGVRALGVELLMEASPCGDGVCGGGTESIDGCSDRLANVVGCDLSDEVSESEGKGEISTRVESDTWDVPVVVGFAASPAFAEGVHAEFEDGAPKRWWNELELRRQRATVPLSGQVLRPRGPFAQHVCEGGSILDLRRCTLAAPDTSALWKAQGCSRGSARAVWALFGGLCRPGSRSRTTCAPAAAAERVRSCPDVAKIIASFTLEPTRYAFEADIHFGLGLSNF